MLSVSTIVIIHMTRASEIFSTQLPCPGGTTQKVRTVYTGVFLHFQAAG